METAKAHVFIKGRVQGVFYRASTCSQAAEFNINGWVKNCVDGSVEAVFEGAKDNVLRMIEWCKTGPSHAIVRDVKIDWLKFDNEFTDFSTRY